MNKNLTPGKTYRLEVFTEEVTLSALPEIRKSILLLPGVYSVTFPQSEPPTPGDDHAEILKRLEALEKEVEHLHSRGGVIGGREPSLRGFMHEPMGPREGGAWKSKPLTADAVDDALVDVLFREGKPRTLSPEESHKPDFFQELDAASMKARLRSLCGDECRKPKGDDSCGTKTGGRVV